MEQSRLQKFVALRQKLKPKPREANAYQVILGSEKCLNVKNQEKMLQDTGSSISTLFGAKIQVPRLKT